MNAESVNVQGDTINFVLEGRLNTDLVGEHLVADLSNGVSSVTSVQISGTISLAAPTVTETDTPVFVGSTTVTIEGTNFESDLSNSAVNVTIGDFDIPESGLQTVDGGTKIVVTLAAAISESSVGEFVFAFVNNGVADANDGK